MLTCRILIAILIILTCKYVYKFWRFSWTAGIRGSISQRAFPLPCPVLWRGWLKGWAPLVLLTEVPTCVCGLLCAQDSQSMTAVSQETASGDQRSKAEAVRLVWPTLRTQASSLPPQFTVYKRVTKASQDSSQGISDNHSHFKKNFHFFWNC